MAEHSYRAQFIAYDLAKDLGEDPAACAHMMMVHDMQECLVGDLTPDSPLRPKKPALELSAAHKLAALSGNNEFLDLFLEYEKNETPRARICHDADQLECLIQALEYARQYPRRRAALEDFWPYVEARLTTAPAKVIFAELLKQKEELLASHREETARRPRGKAPAHE